MHSGASHYPSCSGCWSGALSHPHSSERPITVRTDAELVEAYRERGEQSAFEELVRRYRQPVFRLVLSILGQAFSGDAEEVAQEVFIRAHRGLASFRGDAQFSS